MISRKILQQTFRSKQKDYPVVEERVTPKVMIWIIQD